MLTFDNISRLPTSPVINENNSLIAQLIKDYQGEKKGGGGSSAAVEASDTMRNNSFVNVLELLSEGQINGLHGSIPGQSIFIDGTPLQNSDSTYNFNGATYTLRTGSLSQDYIPGFATGTPSVVTTGLPQPITVANGGQTHTMSNTSIKAVTVTLALPNGLKKQNTSNGNIDGTSFVYRISRKPTSSGTWEQVVNETKAGKSAGAYSWQVKVTQPYGLAPGTTWDVKVQRITADSTTSNIADVFQVTAWVETDEHTSTYAGYAYIGVNIDARQFGSAVPVRSYLIDGVNIKVPSNYNLSTHTFSGLWDGSFVIGFSDDPAWILYDLLRNPTYGCGLYGITEAQIDKFSFYNASVFNNALVSDGFGGTERRFTFNALIAQRTDMLTTLLNLAGVMNATLAYVNGLITLVQDRPSNAVAVVNKSTVKNGLFTYKTTPLNTRTTAVNVTWSNKTNKYLPTVTNVTANAQAVTDGWISFNGVSRYGYNPDNIAAWGATTEGQAKRAARWWVYSNLIQKEIVEFSTGLNGANYNIGDVVSIYDEDYTNQSGAGRIVSATLTSVTFDRPIVVSGSPSVSVVLDDGVTYETHAITNGAGTYTTVNIAGTGNWINQETGVTGTTSGGWSVIPTSKNAYNITSAIAPRTFRIMDIKQNTSNPAQVDFIGILYDKNNYTAIESGLSITAGTYTLPNTQLISSVTGVTVTEVAANISQNIRRQLLVAWTSPASGIADHYNLKYRRDYGNYITIMGLTSAFCDIPDIIDGLYEIWITAVNSSQIMAPATQAFYTANASGSGTTLLNQPTSLSLIGGGTTSTAPDYMIQWTNPSTNTNLTSVLKDFAVTVKNGTTVLRIDYVPAVAAGAVVTYTYDNATNTTDNGGVPIRSINVEVRARDTLNNLGTATTATFTNPAPAVPSSITLTAGFENVAVTTSDGTTPADFVGTAIWASTTTGFTPSQANRVWTQPGKVANLSSKVSTNYYYRVAWYDTFSDQNLTMSSELSSTTLAPDNTNAYQLTGATWTPNSPSTNYVSWTGGVIVKTQGVSAGTTWTISSGNAVWSSGVLYIYYTEGETILRTTTSITTAVSSNKIILATYKGGTSLQVGNGNAYMDGSFLIAGTVGASQLVVGTAVITQSAQIADATITNAKFSTLSGDKLDVSKVTATNLSALSANLGTVTAGTISNNAGTNTINLGATGASYFINTPGMKVYANGSAIFSGTLGVGASLPASQVTGLASVATTGTLAASSVSGLASVATTGVALSVNGGGSFSGALSAASGTFAGTLTAAAVNAVDFINIKDNAVSTSRFIEYSGGTFPVYGSGITIIPGTTIAFTIPAGAGASSGGKVAVFTVVDPGGVLSSSLAAAQIRLSPNLWVFLNGAPLYQVSFWQTVATGTTLYVGRSRTAVAQTATYCSFKQPMYDISAYVPGSYTIALGLVGVTTSTVTVGVPAGALMIQSTWR